MTRSVAVIVAHPDDEVLGCGASISWHVAKGDKVSLLVLSDGEQARATSDFSSQQKRESSLIASSRVLGINSIETANFPDNAFDTVSLLSITQRIEEFIHHCRPHLIYTHSPHDLNIDHQIVSRAVLTAARPQPESVVRSILAMEVLSASEWNFSAKATFSPNVFRDVTDYVALKMEALKCYQQEMRPAPHSRSVENVSHQLAFRGHSVGFVAAEAFELIYSLEFN